MPSTHTIETIGNVTLLLLQDPKMFDFERIPSTTQLLDTILKDTPRAHRQPVQPASAVDGVDSDDPRRHGG